jgi:hypothetical protein
MVTDDAYDLVTVLRRQGYQVDGPSAVLMN